MISNTQLKNLLLQSRQKGEPTKELLKAVRNVAFAQPQFYTGVHIDDKDDCLQLIYKRFCRTWQSIDPERNPKSYIIFMVRSEASAMYRKNFNRRKRISYESEIAFEDENNALEKIASKASRVQAFTGVFAAVCT